MCRLRSLPRACTAALGPPGLQPVFVGWRWQHLVVVLGPFRLRCRARCRPPGPEGARQARRRRAGGCRRRDRFLHPHHGEPWRRGLGLRDDASGGGSQDLQHVPQPRWRRRSRHGRGLAPVARLRRPKGELPALPLLLLLIVPPGWRPWRRGGPAAGGQCDLRLRDGHLRLVHWRLACARVAGRRAPCFYIQLCQCNCRCSYPQRQRHRRRRRRREEPAGAIQGPRARPRLRCPRSLRAQPRLRPRPLRRLRRLRRSRCAAPVGRRAATADLRQRRAAARHPAAGNLLVRPRAGSKVG
mmetsp:Transcript_63843/g.183381  ORF Transcript_63843/g.183381 Transcript_63843/m.183381 type:complete len:298 (+) Transcript_63843:278-1171(+)